VSDWYDDSLDPTDDDDGTDEDDLFDWDDDNLDHGVHGVTPEEGEEALLDPRRIGTDAYNSKSERRWAVIGATENGRILYVVFTKRSNRVRIITAWDASAGDRRRYRRR
jgi:uncharacterized protein